MELALQENDGLVHYYNLENTTMTPWSDVASLFIQVCSTEIERVDTKAWLMAVERVNREEGREVPAAVLLEFYSSYAESDSRIRLSTEKAVRISKAIEYGTVTSELMSRYISWI